MISPFVMVVGCIVIITMMMRGHGGMRMPLGRNDDPLDILRARVARGEIDKAEFEDWKRLLSQS
jgi:uncharacterized membrane protein